MALEQYIDFAGISGEAQAPDVRGAVSVLRWTFSLNTGPEANHAAFEGFTFTKRVDSTSPLLLALCAQRTVLPQAKLVVRSTGHKDPRVVIDLRDVRVTELVAGWDEASSDLCEQVTLHFAKVWFGGAVVDRRGSSEQINWFAWDLEHNRPAS